MERAIISSLEAEYRRYKLLGDGAFEQVTEDELGASASATDSSIATIVWHISGNLRSRFTDFLTTDGEKPWRDRDSEFLPRRVRRGEMLERWEEGWRILFGTLAELTDADLPHTVTIRGTPHGVHAALHRSLAHTSYHVGQIVYLAKSYRGNAWKTLSR